MIKSTTSPANALEWLTSLPLPTTASTVRYLPVYCREMGDNRVILEHNNRQREVLFDGQMGAPLTAFLDSMIVEPTFRFYSDQIDLTREQFQEQLQQRATAKTTIAPVAIPQTRRGTRECRRSVD